jgi:hypothetical protein
MDRPSTCSRSATSSGVSQKNRNFICVDEALKLMSPFTGNKQEIGNEDTAFAVINPKQEAILYNFVLTRISGEPRTTISQKFG